MDHVDFEVCTWVYVCTERIHTPTRSRTHSKPKLYNMTTSDQIHNISFVFVCACVLEKFMKRVDRNATIPSVPNPIKPRLN